MPNVPTPTRPSEKMHPRKTTQPDPERSRTDHPTWTESYQDGLPTTDRFPVNDFRRFAIPFRGSLHLSLTVLRSLSDSCLYLALDETHHPYWGCILKQPDSLEEGRWMT